MIKNVNINKETFDKLIAINGVPVDGNILPIINGHVYSCMQLIKPNKEMLIALFRVESSRKFPKNYFYLN